MSSTPRLFRNTLVLVAAELLIKVFNLVFFSQLARHAGAAGLGRWTYAVSFTGLFMSLFSFGLPTLFTRESAGHVAGEQSLLNRFLGVRLALTGAALAVLAPVAWLLRGTAAPALIMLFAAGLAVTQLGELVRAVFRARQRLEYEAALNLVERAASALLGTGVLLLGAGLVPVAAAWAAGPALAALLALFWVARAGLRFRPAVDRTDAAGILRQAAPLFILGVFATIYFRQDVLLLRWLRTEREVGLYGAAYRVFDMFLFVPGSLALAYLPAAAAARARSAADLGSLCRRTLTLTFGLSAPLAVALCMRAPGVVSLLFGPGFEGAVPAVRVLVWTLLFSFANTVLGNTLISARLQRLPALAVGLATALNAGINLLLIPRIGILGAAWATLLTEIFLFAFQGGFVVRRLVPMNLLAPAALPALAATGTAGVLWLARGLPLVPALAAGAAAHLVLGLALKLWSLEEWRALVARRIGAEEA